MKILAAILLILTSIGIYCGKLIFENLERLPNNYSELFDARIELNNAEKLVDETPKEDENYDEYQTHYMEILDRHKDLCVTSGLTRLRIKLLVILQGVILVLISITSLIIIAKTYYKKHMNSYASEQVAKP